MEFEKKRTKLKMYRALRRKLELTEIEIEEFEVRARTAAEKITPGESDSVRASGGKMGNKIGDYAERDSRLELLHAKKKHLENQILIIKTAIDNIENVYYQNAVYSAYVLGMTDAEIAYAEKISESSARRWRNEGVRMIKF